jgi:hypothetical protein
MLLNIPFGSQEIPAVALICTRQKEGNERPKERKEYERCATRM